MFDWEKEQEQEQEKEQEKMTEGLIEDGGKMSAQKTWD